jgi:hypothetical protein
MESLWLHGSPREMPIRLGCGAGFPEFVAESAQTIVWPACGHDPHLAPIAVDVY